MTNGTVPQSNHKGWLYLWKDRYEAFVSSHEDDETVTPTSASLHWWPTGTEGHSRATAIHSRERSNWGHREPTFIADERQAGANSGTGLAFLEDEYGQWVHYTFGSRAASDAEANDGFMRVYINGELALAWEGTDGGSDRPGRNGYDRGYIMGWHNAVYSEDTTYYLTDFKVGTTRESVIPEPSTAMVLETGAVLCLLRRWGR